MSQQPRSLSAFEIVHQNLRNTLAYLYSDLKMPADTIRLQVAGILQSFKVAELYEREQPPPKGQA